MKREIQHKTCSKCLLLKPVAEFYYHRTRKYYMESCKLCNNAISTKYGAARRSACDPRFLLMVRAGDIRRRAKLLGIPVMPKLSRYLFSLWESQCGLCFYTGRSMTLDGGYHRDDSAATVDRIKPEAGYVEGNLAICTALVNRVKQNLSINELISLVGEIRQHVTGG
jgi:hypothetical protein